MTNKRTRRPRIARQLVCEEERYHKEINIGSKDKPNYVRVQAIYNELELMGMKKPYDRYTEEEFSIGVQEFKKRMFDRGVTSDLQRLSNGQEITLE